MINNSNLIDLEKKYVKQTNKQTDNLLFLQYNSERYNTFSNSCLIIKHQFTMLLPLLDYKISFVRHFLYGTYILLKETGI